jgi:hypothetical protein
MKVNDIVYGMQTVQIRMPHGVICYQANTGLHPTGDRLLQLYREAITTIADALNAPVLATEEVLAGLPDEGTVDCTWEDLPKFEVQVSPNDNYDEEKEVMWVTPFYAFDEYPCEAGVTFGNTTMEGWFAYAPYYTEDGDWNLALQSVEGFKIRATNAETAEYLRQFTRQGVRRVGNA